MNDFQYYWFRYWQNVYEKAWGHLVNPEMIRLRGGVFDEVKNICG